MVCLQHLLSHNDNEIHVHYSDGQYETRSTRAL